MSVSRISMLQERWSWIETHRRQIATELNQIGAEMPRQDRILLKRLASWFFGNQGYEAAIRRPDVLAVCLPLIQSDGEEKPSQADVGRAVRIGVCSIGRTIFNRGSLSRLFLYPAFIFAALAMFTVLFSVAITPHFESLFAEFEINLPGLSVLVFKIFRIARSSWLIALACVAGFAVFVLLINILTSGRRNVAETWMDQRFKTTRNAVADWAWHLAMLLDSGFVAASAIEIAGNSQKKHWLKNACQNWIRERSTTEVADKNSHSRLLGNRFHLINTTLGIDNRAAQVDLLKEISLYYWTRNRTISDWWIQWLNSILLWILVMAIAMVVFAIYSPLLALISGLTGSI